MREIEIMCGDNLNDFIFANYHLKKKNLLFIACANADEEISAFISYDDPLQYSIAKISKRYSLKLESKKSEEVTKFSIFY